MKRILKKTALRDVEGFSFRAADGTPLDPDAAVEPFGALRIPVLNVAGNWGNGDSLERGLIMTYAMNEGRFDRDRLVRSQLGRQMAEDMRYEYKYDRVEDPALIAEMEEKGLVYSVRYNELNERYIVAAPREAVESGTKLPVVLILQEVYGGNEHLAVTANDDFIVLV